MSMGRSGCKTLLHVPAVQAAAIQLSAFLAALGMAQVVSLLTQLQLTLAMAAVLQGVLAASASRLWGLESWWLAIQALFPMALVAMLSLQLPPYLFLIAFIALLGLYWSTFRTQVPFYPSGLPVWQAVSALLPADRPVRFVDVGSGLGGLVLHLSRAHGQSRFVGIEIAPLPWLFSMLRSCFARGSARFVRGDYERVDFGPYDVVFAYLSPAAMPALWEKARAEMRAGSLLLSYEFEIPGVTPHMTSMPFRHGPALYGWLM